MRHAIQRLNRYNRIRLKIRRKLKKITKQTVEHISEAEGSTLLGNVLRGKPNRHPELTLLGKLKYTIHSAALLQYQPLHSSIFPGRPTRNITSHSMKNLAFYSLLLHNIILTTSPTHISLTGWENVHLDMGVRGSIRVNQTPQIRCLSFHPK